MKTFVSSSGKTILVGRNSRENNYLTLKIARSHDMFLHASDFAGSHVILQLDNGDSPTRKDLEEAARLAAYYSKGKDRKAVKVDYTLKENVKKPRKAPAGLVEISNHKSLKVKKDEMALKDILGRELI